MATEKKVPNSKDLKKAGYEVHLAEQWNPGELTSVDLVLMDITLKDGDFGAVNVAALREADVNVPIFLYSGAPEDDFRTLTELCRATGYIPKGDPELLVSKGPGGPRLSYGLAASR